MHQTIQNTLRLVLICLILQTAVNIPGGPTLLPSGPSSALAADQPNIQWFKDQMKISDKYVEHQGGILGMSWAHFFTMVILVLFAGGALVVMVLRYRRTQQIIDEIRKEK